MDRKNEEELHRRMESEKQLRSFKLDTTKDVGFKDHFDLIGRTTALLTKLKSAENETIQDIRLNLSDASRVLDRNRDVIDFKLNIDHLRLIQGILLLRKYNLLQKTPIGSSENSVLGEQIISICDHCYKTLKAPQRNKTDIILNDLTESPEAREFGTSEFVKIIDSS